jgi:hypothetical protein
MRCRLNAVEAYESVVRQDALITPMRLRLGGAGRASDCGVVRDPQTGQPPPGSRLAKASSEVRRRARQPRELRELAAQRRDVDGESTGTEGLAEEEECR